MDWFRREPLSRDTKNAAYSLKQALDAFNGVASCPPVPGLQAGISCLLTVLNTIQNSRANAESIGELNKDMKDLTETVNKYTETSGQNASPQVETAVNKMLSSWKTIKDEAVKITSWRKLLSLGNGNRDRDAGKVAGFVQDLSQSMLFLSRLIGSEMFLRFWERLPTKLRDHIYDLLPSTVTRRKSGLSALSLISQSWCQHFRPRLFAQLSLRTEEDCRMLYSIVRSPLSAWLAEHITKLHFYHTSPHDYLLWTALVRLLPACRNIQHHPSDKSIRVLLSHSAGLKSSLRSITSLTLWDCSFPSFRILLRTLGDITYLEKVDFIGVTWSGDQLTTADATSNVCTGAFSHIRSVLMWECTNNMVVPAWMLAAASTRHSFSRRRTAGPAVPAETCAIIELIRTFFDDSELALSRFDVKEATADTYRFVGSLSSEVLKSNPHVSVQVVKSAPYAGGNEAWFVRQIVLADCESISMESHPYLHTRDWSMVTSLLYAFPRLERFQVLRGEKHSKEDFCMFSDRVVGGLNSHTKRLVTLQYDPDLPDGRYLQPALFDLTEADVEEAREKKRQAKEKDRWRRLV